ncbi:hypothetical protein GT045_01750 [Streptomyces sp. SID486]|uniref:hypothetical protein n=1 Tax=Streptomyces sp. SID486 TaxID=2690264 RepID=UPI00136A0F11|nr:hypothetical protein [Streptomyces sp. SID486]MYX93573.1 hypothetical protein [Streptomyces sp. SID486]
MPQQPLPERFEGGEQAGATTATVRRVAVTFRAGTGAGGAAAPAAAPADSTQPEDAR